jgi:hypothetical protein
VLDRSHKPIRLNRFGADLQIFVKFLEYQKCRISVVILAPFEAKRKFSYAQVSLAILYRSVGSGLEKVCLGTNFPPMFAHIHFITDGNA